MFFLKFLIIFAKVALHKKWTFRLRISSVNVTKSARSSVFLFMGRLVGKVLPKFSWHWRWQVNITWKNDVYIKNELLVSSMVKTTLRKKCPNTDQIFGHFSRSASCFENISIKSYHQCLQYISIKSYHQCLQEEQETPILSLIPAKTFIMFNFFHFSTFLISAESVTVFIFYMS